jgi:hypothetical protein
MTWRPSTGVEHCAGCSVIHVMPRWERVLEVQFARTHVTRVYCEDCGAKLVADLPVEHRDTVADAVPVRSMPEAQGFVSMVKAAIDQIDDPKVRQLAEGDR